MVTLPSWVPARPRLNFITIHYIFIIGMALLGSVLLYPVKNMAYIDCLFHASGSSTQSGLNTVDLNTITLYQQIVLTLIAMIANPIVINTAVVYVRLYWFEKRFQTVVQEAKERLITRRTKSKEVDNPECEERGVGNRTIRVLHRPQTEPEQTTASSIRGRRSTEVNGQPDGHPIDPEKSDRPPTSGLRRLTEEDTSNSVNNKDNEDDFAIADDDEEEENPPFSPTAQHIAFVETQRGRGRKDSAALRIPSPREFENGGVIRANIDDTMEGHNDENHPVNGEDTIEPVKKTITIEAPATTHASGPRLRMRRISDAAKGTMERMFPKSATFEKALSNTFKRHRSSSPASRKTMEPMPYLSYTPTIGRNSAFVDLTDEQRDELGGIEYRSLKVLAWILVGYTVFWQIFSYICLVPWILHAQKYKKMIHDEGVNSVWWGIFTGSSAFTDLGFTLTPDSMSSFSTVTWVLIVMMFLIIIGNTGFPCFLRFKIWLFWKILPEDVSVRECLHFLLDHPRRCFTLLFPSKATWWLFAILIILNVVDMTLFIILDLRDSTVTTIPVGYRILDATFQAVSTRTAGFACVNLAELHPAIQVSYMIMMYISIFPIAISVRRTNVYEEKSLGIYGNAELEAEKNREPSFIGAHLRKQLSFDLWYIFLGFFFICIAEGGHIENRSDYAFTQFSILFEVVSAYGTVGMSLGYPNTNASFSAQFTPFSKFIIIMMQIRGRHRGLPYELDRAILLPSESLQAKEAEDAIIRHQRRNSMASTLGGPGFPRTMSAKSGVSNNFARVSGRDETQQD